MINSIDIFIQELLIKEESNMDVIEYSAKLPFSLLKYQPKEIRLKKFLELLWKEEAPEKANHENLACSVYLSLTYLKRLLKMQTGESLEKILLKMSLEKFKDALINTQKSISIISIDLGVDQSFICRKFKCQFGMTPMQYRRINKN